jgi:membrane-associated phospholipid phosphatase
MKKFLDFFNSYSRIIFGLFYLIKKQNYIFLLYLLNILLNIILKNCIKQKRPSGSYHTSYGMPSGHAQAVGFFLMSQIMSKNPYWPLLVPISLEILYSRIDKKHHTPSQVIIGFLIGMIFFYFTKIKNSK